MISVSDVFGVLLKKLTPTTGSYRLIVIFLHPSHGHKDLVFLTLLSPIWVWALDESRGQGQSPSQSQAQAGLGKIQG